MALLVLVLAAPGADIHGQVSTWYFDRLLSLNPRECQELPIEIVDIDDASLRALGQWPWPRRYVAELISRIGDAGAAVIVLDMVFSEADRFSAATLSKVWPEARTAVGGIPDFDQEFGDRLSAYRVVGATALLGKQNENNPALKAGFASLGKVSTDYFPVFQGALVNIPPIVNGLIGVGSISTLPGEDSFVRSIPLIQKVHERNVPGLVAEAVRVAQGVDTFVLKSVNEGHTFGDVASFHIGGLAVPMTLDGQMRLHYSSCVPSVQSAAKILTAEQQTTSDFANKIVIIGSSAAVLGDVVTLPSNRMIPGVQVQAQALEQMLMGWFLSRPYWVFFLEWVAILIGSLLVLLTLRKGVLISTMALLSLALLLFGASWRLLNVDRILLDAWVPVLSVAGVLGAQSFFSFMFAERDRLWIRKAFSQYLSPALVQQLADQPKRLRLGGEKREMTFLFTDIAGFTALTERTPASQLVSLLNVYLDGACRVVMDYGGTIDKIVGDAIHTVFNAPLDQPDHAERAVKCAIALDHFAEEFRKTPEPLEAGFGVTRIGINTGDAVVGNFGGSQRFDYTAHGDAINTAARLEAANKSLGTRICVADTTVQNTKHSQFRPVGALKLKGKSVTVEVYEPMEIGDPLRASQKAYCHAWNLIFSDHQAAFVAFERLLLEYPADPLLALQLRRLSGEKWEEVINLEG